MLCKVIHITSIALVCTTTIYSLYLRCCAFITNGDYPPLELGDLSNTLESR